MHSQHCCIWHIYYKLPYKYFVCQVNSDSNLVICTDVWMKRRHSPEDWRLLPSQKHMSERWASSVGCSSVHLCICILVLSLFLPRSTFSPCRRQVTINEPKNFFKLKRAKKSALVAMATNKFLKVIFHFHAVCFLSCCNVHVWLGSFKVPSDPNFHFMDVLYLHTDLENCTKARLSFDEDCSLVLFIVICCIHL